MNVLRNRKYFSPNVELDRTFLVEAQDKRLREMKYRLFSSLACRQSHDEVDDMRKLCSMMSMHFADKNLELAFFLPRVVVEDLFHSKNHHMHRGLYRQFLVIKVDKIRHDEAP